MQRGLRGLCRRPPRPRPHGKDTALTLLAVVTRTREGRADFRSSDADRPARAAWAVPRLLADVATSF